VGLAGCSSSTSVGGEASSFLREHASAATGTAAAARAVESEVARLSSRGSGSEALARLAREASRAHRAAVQASEWSPAAGSEAGSEEENLERAEAQVTEGAEELARATAAIEGYARARGAAARARYASEMAHAREQWNEGVAQLWFLARRRNPPTL
jgi:hypothetical protein